MTTVIILLLVAVIVIFAVKDIRNFCSYLENLGVPITRQPAAMKFDHREIIAFIQDPDGYPIELIEKQ